MIWKKKFLFELGVAAIVLMVAGCGNDSSSGVQDGPACDDAAFTSVCDGVSARFVCNEGKKVSVPCETGTTCKGGQCTAIAALCDADTFAPKCDSDKKSRIVCEDGQEATKPCDHDEICEGGACVVQQVVTPCDGNEPECLGSERYAICENDVRVEKTCDSGLVCVNGSCETPPRPGDGCDEAFVQYCIDDVNVAACQNGTVTTVPCGDRICSAGACVEKPCSEDDVPTCKNDAQILECKSGILTARDCDEGEICSDGECRTLAEGDPCDPEKFSSVCLDDMMYYECVENKLKKSSCPESRVCLNGMCSECNPESFVKKCDMSDVHKNTFILCEESTDVPGQFLLKYEGCPKSNAVCLDGNCVQCDPEAYKAVCSDGAESKCDATGQILVTPCAEGLKCVDGFTECTAKCSKASDCPTREDGLTYACEANQCVLITECDVSLDKPTCNGEKRKICQDPGKWVELSCDGGNVCTGVGECVACTADSHCGSGNVCDTSSHTCVECLSDTNCTGSNKVCLNKSCVECNPSTYGTQCVDNAPATCNSEGQISEQSACSGNSPVCINGKCEQCNGAVEAGKITCDGNTAKTCNSNNSVSSRTCASNETCQPNKGCVSKCGEGFSVHCDGRHLVTCSDSGTEVKTECAIDHLCSVDKCTRECSGNINECVEYYDGDTVLRTCYDGRVIFMRGYPSGFWCGTLNGKTDWYQTCPESDKNTDAYGTLGTDCSVVRCMEGKDKDNITRFGYYAERTQAVCETYSMDMFSTGRPTTMTYSKSCKINSEGEMDIQYYPCVNGCHMGICNEWTACHTPTASCTNDRYANNCVHLTDKLGTWKFPQWDCRTTLNVSVNANCITWHDDQGALHAGCDKEYSSIGLSMKGVCYNNAVARIHYDFTDMNGVTQGPHFRLYSCNGKCKTNDDGYAYCGK